ncbi:DUF7139 domain-containing protein [Halosegnis marinus]|uniref:Permease n=1 Tax=Halosegnis marinus TaxID=3034023 RepID=A0ABD5ZST2_9EURY|nr:hypothetical protein [Halosegnis sp. DT85]
MDTALDDRADALYRRYLGEPERDLDVYLGFALFIGGFALGILGLVLFGVEQAVSGARPVWWLREIAFVVAALGLPTLMLGVTVLLPVDRRASYAAGAGLAITVAAAGLFVSVYPRQWNTTGGTDFALQGVLVYAVGLVTVIAATGAALVSYHVERTSGVPAAAAGDGEAATADATDGEDEEAVAEQARRDYEEAMAGADVTWGGVEKADVSRRLSLNPDEIDDVDAQGFDPENATTTRSSGSGVDAAVSGLDAMRGGNEQEARSEDTTGDSAAALAELRQQQEHEEEQRKQERSPVERLRDRLGLD